MTLTVRPLQDGELRQLYTNLGVSFGFDAIDTGFDNFAQTAELDRTRCAFDGERMVGTLSAYSLDLTVPGGSLLTSGTTWVTVLPSHRRRGALREMMRAHLEDTRDRGEPMAALWASESGIYIRFGYGMAAYSCSFEIATDRAQFASEPETAGSMRLLTPEEAASELPPIYDSWWGRASSVPGNRGRSAVWWKHHLFWDPRSEREGASEKRFAVYEEAGQARGFIIYRVRSKSQDRRPAGRLEILNLHGLDGSAEAALWRFALDVDLMRTVEFHNAPVDSVLPHVLADPRQLKLGLADGLWLRPIDPAAMLAGRRYSIDGRLVMEVSDEQCPWVAGRYELVVESGRAECKPSGAEPDLLLSAEALGAVYLGGIRLAALARAGRVAATPDSLRRADLMFSWDPLPWCSDDF